VENSIIKNMNLFQEDEILDVYIFAFFKPQINADADIYVIYTPCILVEMWKSSVLALR